MALLNAKDSERLTMAKILWLATVSPNSIPHLVPVWFVLNESKLYICTSEKSEKFSHIKGNCNVAFALEDGISPVSGNGKVIIRKPNEKNDILVIRKFKEKIDWNILTDKQYTILLEIEITKLLMRKN